MANTRGSKTASKRWAGPGKSRASKKSKGRAKLSFINDAASANDESATSDTESVLEESNDRAKRTGSDGPGKPRQATHGLKPTMTDLIQNKQPEFKNVLLHEIASELVEGKSEAEGELLGLLISSKFIPVLVMMQGTSYPQLGHSLFQYNSSARNADENHRDVVLFVGDRTIRGDPTAFVIDMEAADTLGKLKEVEVGLGDEEIEEFLQDPSNDGQLLGQARSLGSKKKSTLVLLPINDNVAEFVATENPSMHDFDAWVNDADNHKVGDAEAAGINEWTHMAVLTNDNDKKKKKSSILAVDLQAITSPSVELSKCMAARLDTTLGRAPHPSPQARSSPVGDARLQRQIDAKKPKSVSSKKRRKLPRL